MEKGAPNFVKVAEAYGIRGVSINNRQELNSRIKEILDYDGPILVDIKVVPDENCYPMVAPGKSNAQMIGV
jgi:acetolactate synthase-1/2/3 large subunit